MSPRLAQAHTEGIRGSRRALARCHNPSVASSGEPLWTPVTLGDRPLPSIAGAAPARRPVRERGGDLEPSPGPQALVESCMLNVFTLANGRLFQEEIESAAALAHLQPVWVDLESPTAEEKGWITGRFGLTIPENIVDDDLEESARFYEEDNGELHIRSDFLIDDRETPRNVRVAFILFKGVLFSVHSEALPVFRLLRLRARRIPALIEDAKDVLLKLYDA